MLTESNLLFLPETALVHWNLKQIESDKYDDYLWGNATYVENETNPTPWMSAMCDWSFDKYAGDQPYVESYYN